jgi:hypothetical protein
MNLKALAETAPRVFKHGSLVPLFEVRAERRWLAWGAVALGAAVAALSEDIEPKEADSNLVVSLGNLGDQLRMLSVLSRYSPPHPISVVVNNGSDLVSMFENVRLERSVENQGVPLLVDVLRRRDNRRFRRVLVPQPFITQPIAIAYARSAGRSVLALGDGIVAGVRRFDIDRSSWKHAYESFFTHALGHSPSSVPQLRTNRWRGYSSSDVILHPAGVAGSKGLAPSVFRAVATNLKSHGYDPIIIGAASERSGLEVEYGNCARIVAGAQLRTIANLLASARAFIGVDSSMMNLSDAVGTPAVIAYTLTDPESGGPFYSSFVPVRAAGIESPGVSEWTSWSKLRRRVGAEVSISAEDLVEAFDRLIHETSVEREP